MAEPLHHVMVVGTGEPQSFQLTEEGLDLVGTEWTVEIVFDPDAAPEDPPTLAWLVQATGKVVVTGCENMAVGRYRWRVKITDGNGKAAFIPKEAARNTWTVARV